MRCLLCDYLDQSLTLRDVVSVCQTMEHEPHCRFYQQTIELKDIYMVYSNSNEITHPGWEEYVEGLQDRDRPRKRRFLRWVGHIPTEEEMLCH